MYKELKTLLKVEQYRRVVTIGVSAGGLPAILTALELGLDAGLSVGGSGPDDPRWLMADRKSPRGKPFVYTRGATAKPELFLVFGADRSNDRANAEALAAVVHARVIAVSNPSEPVGHNALYSLVEQGKLTEFLNNTIFNQSPQTG
jgi:hypothetical protein